jgi:hypothetical protein
LGDRLGREHDVRRLAQWWTQATDESRFRLLQRVQQQVTPLKGDPPLDTLRLAILIAEAEAGQVDETS